MLQSGLNKAQKAKTHVDEALEKVRAKPWATPLGKALKVSGNIVEAVDGFVPGAKFLGGALSFGATLLNPELTPQDLQDQLREIKASIEAHQGQPVIVQSLTETQVKLEEKIARQFGEIRAEIQEVHTTMRQVYSEVTESSKVAEEEMTGMKGMMGETFNIVVDSRFKVKFPLKLLPLYLFVSSSASINLHLPVSGRD